MGNTYQNGYKKQMAIKYTKVAYKLSNGHGIPTPEISIPRPSKMY
jgi:hypothetical protein